MSVPTKWRSLVHGRGLFVSGLPRSGSTLLSALLRQRPGVYAGMSSPVAPLMQALMTAMGIRQEWSPLIGNDQRRRLLRGLLENYYATAPEYDVIFDTNRMWCARLPLLMELFPEARIIACVRKPQFVLNSFESMFRKQPLLMSRMFTVEQGQNVYSRVEALAAPDGTYGFAHRALREAYYGEHADKLVLIDYEALTNDPSGTMTALYEALDLPAFEHDFDNIRYDGGDEFDTQFGLPGMHRVEPRIRAGERYVFLPPDLITRFRVQDFWNRPQNGSKIRAILSTSGQEQ